jgi:nitroimidazol reductase NimA-like FMN-containing flavoprotein (pyridoxamine 5'-phosphate oxidase superfamily)
MFDAKVEIVTDRAEKLRALERLIEKYEPDPAAMKERMLSRAQIDKVEVLRVRVAAFSGKQSPAAE